jgi:hypothetical protein
MIETLEYETSIHRNRQIPEIGGHRPFPVKVVGATFQLIVRSRCGGIEILYRRASSSSAVVRPKRPHMVQF